MKYGGCTAKLRMDRVILEDSFFDETEYLCKIIAYDEEEETLYLVSEEAELTFYSLDGIYECSIEDPKDPVVCKGILKERYWNKAGRVMKFKIQNGFYKKVLNYIESVLTNQKESAILYLESFSTLFY